ncbi:MAG: M23 family metallopeptidase [Bacteroidales bacterium]|jgi:murein DD-endopeptidase MepM/ murein hydrolase activator NlpD|nr:M23 family metallopeptidase [Bacteroidales bacterium]MDX9927619.1 M23 family metallopeptidase [Bacteroidales bacterium]HNX83415.1 M23 family metallopeptidase [Bacteroidales bacterium]HOC49114.1 M23 family metallopeptidase [Bacteroidales bacterium]HPS98886.1 M23 family metallopeptidase [Bacteroidales bacterium]
MAKNEKRKGKWTDRFRFAIFNDTTFEELWRIRLSKANALLAGALLLVITLALNTSLIAFTNLREFIPGYPDVEMRRNILMNAIMLDSLEHELEIRDKYFRDLNDVISGRQPASSVTLRDSTRDYSNIEFRKSSEDSLFRARVEKEDKYSLSASAISPGIPSTGQVTSLANIHFFPPAKGIISSNFDTRTRHYATDIVTQPKAVVSSTLDGTVIMTGWTMETGFVIMVQHANNLVSVYKHNARLLKEMGDRVRAGEPISIVGDSGELYTSGPHLHFELWHNGEALDPAQYVYF